MMADATARMTAVVTLLVMTPWVPMAASDTNGAESAASPPPAPGDARLIHVSDDGVAVKIWEVPDEHGRAVPYYSIRLDGDTFTEPIRASYDLKLRYANFDPMQGEVDVAGALRAGAHTSLYIVQFVTQPLEAYRASIRDLGGTVYTFLANHAHIVKMDPAVRAKVDDLPFVRWVGPYHPAYRVESFLLENANEDGFALPSLRYNIMVFEAGPGQKGAVAGRIRAIGGNAVKPNAGKFLVEATLSAAQLGQVITWDEVLFVDRWTPYESDMDIVRNVGGAVEIEVIGGWTGAGVRGEVFDTGFNVIHVDFASHPLIEHTPVSETAHGASTSGIVFGDGTGDANARGLLPDGQGIIADWHEVSVRSRYDHGGELIEAPYYALFQTASVGSMTTLTYTTISADTDAMLFDFDIVHLQSQSNTGGQFSRPQAWAKNIISVGGIRHQGTLSFTDDCWCGQASIGPAADGRIKPDLSHFNDAILTVSGLGEMTYTESFGGTSAATPIVAGHVGLFFQMWSEGIFGNRAKSDGTVFESRAHMTTAKAMLINTALQYPFSGTGHDLTRTHQGWGMPNLMRMYELRDKMFIVDETDLLTNLQTIPYTLEVAAETPFLRATLVYADPPGMPGSTQHRINDLTLKITSPEGVVYWGNHGLHTGVVSQPGGEPNTIDTVEHIVVPAPIEGIWIVEVIGAEINEDGHVETSEIDADFALVVSGVVREPATIDADLDDDGDVDYQDLLFVLMSWGACPTPPISSGCPADFDGSGDVDLDDLLLLLTHWTTAPIS